jgi:pimeloyl-ACP methyl ester carboxylesterase
MSAAETAARALLAGATRSTVALPERGVEIALLDWGGDGPLALLHHANGFCKGVWGLVADQLRTHYRVVAMDARGHGDSTHPEGPQAYLWDHFAEDLVGVAAHLVSAAGRPIALGLGHSFGGTSMIGAAARRADLFERLLLVDPVTPPPPSVYPAERHVHMRRLIDGARRRRAHWPSRGAARAYCYERPFFSSWDPVALELYLLDGMRERADGSMELKCPGAVEGAVFAGSAAIDVFDLARRVTIPTHILWARHGDFPRPVYETIAASMRKARVDDVDSGHLVPMIRPGAVVAAALERVI